MGARVRKVDKLLGSKQQSEGSAPVVTVDMFNFVIKLETRLEKSSHSSYHFETRHVKLRINLGQKLAALFPGLLSLELATKLRDKISSKDCEMFTRWALADNFGAGTTTSLVSGDFIADLILAEYCFEKY